MIFRNSRTRQLFEAFMETPVAKPRAKPRKLMKCVDCGPGYDKGYEMARFQCPRCQHEGEWEQHTWTEIRRGIPCPNCNKPPDNT